MKKFYLCKLCLIVFGALLAVQQVIAFPNTGSFACEVTDTTAIQIVRGVPSLTTDPALIGSSLVVRYKILKVRVQRLSRRLGQDPSAEWKMVDKGEM
jgi:hypothetical protein